LNAGMASFMGASLTLREWSEECIFFYPYNFPWAFRGAFRRIFLAFKEVSLEFLVLKSLLNINASFKSDELETMKINIFTISIKEMFKLYLFK
jgi:hypothetical protein